MDGEQHSYIRMMAKVSGLLPANVLQNVSREVTLATKRADEILKDSPTSLKAFQEYRQGFM